MPDPSIRIVLDEGGGSDTWVVRYPVRGWDSFAVITALQEATQAFRDSIFRDEKAVERKLRETIARG